MPNRRPLPWLVLIAVLAGIATHTRAATVPSGFIEEVVSGGWNEVVGLTFAPDGRMVVWERNGKVWMCSPTGQRPSAPLLDISEEVGGWRDFGLLSVALHPNFENNGYLYLYYIVDHHHLVHFGLPTYSSTTDEYFMATIGRITRYTANASDNFTTVDLASRKILVGETIRSGIPSLHQTHGTGTILFGTDGTLLASAGDGATFNAFDTGGDVGGAYATQALAEGIIDATEDVGSFRAQLVGSLCGKILRLDPETGNGVPSNPFFDPTNPRSAQSRTWALGFRNPYRMSLRPGTGSHDRNDANPGVLYLGDVGLGSWEELDVVTAPGQNFGWPIFEGMEAHSGFSSKNTLNYNEPNPLFGVSGCNRDYFRFRELLIQDTLLPNPSFPNPCNSNIPIGPPNHTFVHTRPAIDWGRPSGPSRTKTYVGNDAAVMNIGASGSPVSGPQFGGNCSTGGVWYTSSVFPASYQNAYFHGDYGQGWIKMFKFDSNNQPYEAADFLSGGGPLVFITAHPTDGSLYYIGWPYQVRRIRYAPTGNKPPTAVAASDVGYGPGPLTVHFRGDQSTDPEGQPLAYDWDFGDGSPNSAEANPVHVFDATPGVPTEFQVHLAVRDSASAISDSVVIISVNNTPPTVTITSPVDGSTYPLDQGDIQLPLSAEVSDAEHGAGELTCEWQTFLHHNDHQHSDPPITSCTASTVLAPLGCDGNIYFYRVRLKVTDSAGLSTIAEARVYPNCATAPPEPASNPFPPDGLLSASPEITLSWTPGAGAGSHQVYFGTNPDPGVGEWRGTRTEAWFDPGPLVYSTTYYWRIDELNGAGVTPGQVWSFTTLDEPPPPPPVPPGPASNPSPAHGATGVLTTADISWTAGSNTTSHEVYFGTTPSPGPAEFKGSQPSTTFDPGALQHSTTYYWRIDEINGDGRTSGPVWAFTTEAAPPPLNSGLVAYWPFDNGSGTVASDTSGNGNHGSLQGPLWTTGKFGGGLEFDGSNDRVVVPDSPSLSLLSNRFTVAFWIFPTDANRAWSTVFQRTNATGNWFDWQFYARAIDAPSRNFPVWRVDWDSDRRNDPDEQVEGDAPLTASTWTFIACTYDGAKLDFHVNGVLKRSTPKVGGVLPNSHRELWIGGNSAWGEYFKGILDEFRVYDRALSQSEIETLAGLAPPPPPPPPPLVLPGPASNPAPLDSANGVLVSASLSWTAGTDTDLHAVYFGTNPNPDAAEFRGSQTATTFVPGTLTYSTTYYWRIDESNADGTTPGPVWSFTTEAAPPPPPPPLVLPGPASNPAPLDSANGVLVSASLSWTAGTDSDLHAVYFGTTPNPDAAEFRGSQTATTFVPGTLAYSTTYYWRIDESNADGTTPGPVWSFTTEAAPPPPPPPPVLPGPASNPAPLDSANGVLVSASLSWTAGTDTDLHAVYFGTTPNPDAAEFRGSQTATTFVPGTLAYSTTYYWRIDESNADGTTPGPVWSFTTEAAPPPPPPPPSGGLVAHWPFDDGVGSAASDISGNNNHGTLQGPIWTAGRNGAALSFDGSNDRVVIPDSPSLSSVIDRLTVTFWIQPTDQNRAWSTILQRTNLAGNWFDFQFYARAIDAPTRNFPVLRVDWDSDRRNDTDEQTQGSAILVAGEWRHFACVYDGNSLRLYMDGILRNSTPKSGGILPNSHREIWIGGNSAWGEYFKGVIDDIRLYNRALDPPEIEALAQ